MLIQDLLVKFRKENGFTQQEIANLIGVERSTYACYETGKSMMPIGKIQLLAVVYNVDLSAFIPNSMLELRSGPEEPPPLRAPDTKEAKEERMMIAKIRLIRAMGKEEELNRMLDELLEEE